jgi:hypothetical protein
MLEKAGHVVEQRPSLTPALSGSGAIPDAVVFDLHFLDQEGQASLRWMCDHLSWKQYRCLSQQLLLSRIGAGDVMLRLLRPGGWQGVASLAERAAWQ